MEQILSTNLMFQNYVSLKCLIGLMMISAFALPLQAWPMPVFFLLRILKAACRTAFFSLLYLIGGTHPRAKSPIKMLLKFEN